MLFVNILNLYGEPLYLRGLLFSISDLIFMPQKHMMLLLLLPQSHWNPSLVNFWLRHLWMEDSVGSWYRLNHISTVSIHIKVWWQLSAVQIFDIFRDSRSGLRHLLALHDVLNSLVTLLFSITILLQLKWRISFWVYKVYLLWRYTGTNEMVKICIAASLFDFFS